MYKFHQMSTPFNNKITNSRVVAFRTLLEAMGTKEYKNTTARKLLRRLQRGLFRALKDLRTVD